MRIFVVAIASLFLAACAGNATQDKENIDGRLRLEPMAEMKCNVLLKDSANEFTWTLQVPEILSSEQDVIIAYEDRGTPWQLNDDGSAYSTYEIPHWVSYEVTLAPDSLSVELSLSVTNLSDSTWRNVWAFNCIRPRDEAFFDSQMDRTFVSWDGEPSPLQQLDRPEFFRPLCFYWHEEADSSADALMHQLPAISSDKVGGSYIVTQSADQQYLMAAVTPHMHHAFNNLEYHCIHASPTLGDIAPGETRTIKQSFYFAKMTLNQFLGLVNR